MNSAKIKKSLQDWKLPPSSPSDVFKRKCFFNFSSERSSSIVKTVEKEIPLSEGYAEFPLFTDHLQRVYKNKYSYLQMEMIQVAVKPTKLGSNTSVIISLRDKRLVKFDESLLGLVESSLCDGPIYFCYFPTHCVHMSDRHLTTAFTIDIKTQGCSRDENVILMYKFHYKPTYSNNTNNNKNVSRSLVGVRGETTLFLTNIVGGRNRVVKKKIYWDKVSLPEAWMVRNDGGGSVSSGDARIDWKEAAEAHVLKVDVPGFKKEEVRVEVEGGRVLQISGERREEEESDVKWHCVERSGGGRFLRRLTLPENAKLGEVKASVENGVLTVTVPKGEVHRKPEVVVVDISG